LGHSGLAGSQGCRDRAEPRSGGRGAETGRPLRLADDDEKGLLGERAERVHDQGARRDKPSGCGSLLSVGDSSSEHLRGERGERAQAAQEGEGAPRERERLRADDCVAGGAHDPEIGIQSIWDRPDWALCDDPSGPRWRPIEPGTFPLAHGAPDRVGRLRGYGNAIVPQVAAEFVGAFLEVTA
jgi:DNA (cytosine-5)-methyltransferase 1